MRIISARRIVSLLRPIAAFVFAYALGALPAGQRDNVGDWPQWHGPDRNNLSTETGLLEQWPPSGPPLVWTISALGKGYGSLAIQGDRILVQGSNGRQSIVYSLNRTDGKGVWSKALGQAGDNDRGPGPRGTPTIDGERVYVLTENVGVVPEHPERFRRPQPPVAH
jgi:hypothetical protein